MIRKMNYITLWIPLSFMGIIEDSHENVLNESELVGNIYKSGVGCKTWDDSDEVKIIFKDISVQNEERLEILSF